MRILITGAGLVGAYTACEVQARGRAVVLYSQDMDHAYLATVVDLARTQTVVGDVTDAAKLAETCQAHGVGAIIHTAALIGAWVARRPMLGVSVDVMGSVAVAEAAHCAGVRRLVFCSSVAIYDLERLAADEAITEDSPAGPKNLYAATKVASEHILRQMAQLYDLELYCLRLAGVLGRGQYMGARGWGASSTGCWKPASTAARKPSGPSGSARRSMCTSRTPLKAWPWPRPPLTRRPGPTTSASDACTPLQRWWPRSGRRCRGSASRWNKPGQPPITCSVARPSI